MKVLRTYRSRRPLPHIQVELVMCTQKRTGCRLGYPLEITQLRDLYLRCRSFRVKLGPTLSNISRPEVVWERETLAMYANYPPFGTQPHSPRTNRRKTVTPGWKSWWMVYQVKKEDKEININTKKARWWW